MRRHSRCVTHQDDGRLNEIIVTETKTGATTAQKTPLALSVFSTQDLEKTGAVNGDYPRAPISAV